MSVFRAVRITGLMTALTVFAVACGSGDAATQPTATAEANIDQPTATVAATVSPTARPVEPTPLPEGTSPFDVYWPSLTIELPPIGAVTDDLGRSVHEVLGLSTQIYENATSYRTRFYPLGVGPDAEIPDRLDFLEYAPPDRIRIVDSAGVDRVIGIGNRSYRRSPSDISKWWLSESEPTPLASAQSPLSIRPFPVEMTGAGFFDLNDPDYYFVEDFAFSQRRVTSAVSPDIYNLYELKIRRSDLATIKVTRWGIPLFIDDGIVPDLTEILVELAQIKSLTRDVVEISDYNIETNIQPPAETFVSASATAPRDGSASIAVDTDISYTIGEPVEIMELTISPLVELSMVSEEPTSGTAIQRTYKSESPLEQGVKYTVTLNWGTGEEDMQTLSWSFTTREPLLRSQ